MNVISMTLSVLLFCLLTMGGPAQYAQAQTSVRSQPIALGEVAPDFTLEGHVGGKFTLSAEAKRQPVLLVFYRGHW